MNIVFDLGGVVFTWEPEKIICNIFDDIEIQYLVKSEIFDHQDWIELDRGTLATEEAINRGAGRTKLSRSKIKELITGVPFALVPIEDTINLLYSLCNTNNIFFVLSNMHHASIEHLESTYNIWDMFTGLVISCRVNKVKPEPEIYLYLLKQFNLSPNETVFINDMDMNLESANKLGIRTIEFVTAIECKQKLVELGCINQTG